MAAQISHKRTTPRCVCPIDPAKHPWEQEKKLHNRWHPDIPHVRCKPLCHAVMSCELTWSLPFELPFVVTGVSAQCHMQIDTVKEGECFRVETQDWTGGQIKDNDSAEDMKNIDLSLVSLLMLYTCACSCTFATLLPGNQACPICCQATAVSVFQGINSDEDFSVQLLFCQSHALHDAPVRDHLSCSCSCCS